MAERSGSSVSFAEMLKHPTKVRKFREFLRTQHSEEFLDFCLAVDEKLDVTYIFRQYISEDAICPLVIDSKSQSDLKTLISNREFSAAAKLLGTIRFEVANNLISDHYLRYRNLGHKNIRKSITIDTPESFRRAQDLASCVNIKPEKSPISPILRLFRRKQSISN